MLEVTDWVITRGAQRWQHSFSLAPGQVLAVVGESGSGKSTLLEALGGFLPKQSGHVVLHGQEIMHWAPEARPVSTLFQDHNLFEHISLRANMALGFARGKPTAEDLTQLDAACEHLGLSGLLSRLPGALSGGQRQRAGLIRTVLRNQPLVLLDEPYSALDHSNRRRAGDWVKQQIQQRQQMLILVSHDPSDVARWADQVLEVAL